MVDATWGDWFVSDEVEGSDPDGLSIWYLGCNGFVLRTPETTAYVDPYFGTGSPPRTVRMIPVPMDPTDATMCDGVFVTHEHIDHMHPPSYGPLVEELGADHYAPSASYEQPAFDGDRRVPDNRRHVVAPGDRYELGDLTVHVRGANDPDAAEPVTYVFEHSAGTFFHPGDTRPDGSLADVGEEFDVDVGAVPYGTVGTIYHAEDDPPAAYPTDWYNDGDMVVEAANQLQLDRLLPTHWDMWKGVGADPTVLHEHAASFEYPRTIEVVRIGDRVDAGRPGVVQMRALRSAGGQT